MELIKFTFQSFWHFIGIFILIEAILIPVLRFIFLCWNRFWRHININKHGYPPAYCDADGDFIKTENK